MLKHWLSIVGTVIISGSTADAFAASRRQHELVHICYVSPPIGHALPRARDVPRQHIGYRAAIADFNRRTAYKARFSLMSDPGARLGLADQIDKAFHANCDVVVGLVRSRDAMLAAPLLKTASLIGISSTAKSSDLDGVFPTVLSSSVSTSAWAQAALQFCRKRGLENIWIVSRRGDETVLSFTRDLEVTFNSEARVTYLLPNGHFDPDFLGSLSVSPKATLIYTTYPMPSLPSLEQLANAWSGENWHIIVNHTWTETHVLQAYSDLFSRAPPLETLSPWNGVVSNQALKRFQKIAEEFDSQKPDHDSVYDFDVAEIIINCAERSIASAEFRAFFQACLTGPIQHVGATGLYVFDGLHAHPQRRLQNHMLEMQGS